MTEQEAVTLAESKFWEPLTHEERFLFQINEPLLCMPFDVFHDAAEKVLGRPVWTHEFASMKSLVEEYEGKRPTSMLADVLDKIPQDKRVIIVEAEKEMET